MLAKIVTCKSSGSRAKRGEDRGLQASGGNWDNVVLGPRYGAGPFALPGLSNRVLRASVGRSWRTVRFYSGGDKGP